MAARFSFFLLYFTCLHGNAKQVFFPSHLKYFPFCVIWVGLGIFQGFFTTNKHHVYYFPFRLINWKILNFLKLNQIKVLTMKHKIWPIPHKAHKRYIKYLYLKEWKESWGKKWKRCAKWELWWISTDFTYSLLPPDCYRMSSRPTQLELECTCLNQSFTGKWPHIVHQNL